MISLFDLTLKIYVQFDSLTIHFHIYKGFRDKICTLQESEGHIFWEENEHTPGLTKNRVFGQFAFFYRI